jgi:hypothetical protein
MMHRWGRATVIAWLTACAAAPGSGDIFVGDTRCTACAVQVIEIGSVGNDSLRPTLDARLASDGSALIAVAPLAGRRSVGLFDMTGSPVGHLALPDEWRAAAAVAFAGDGSLLLMSEQRSRLVRLSPQGRVTRDVPLPANSHRFVIAGGHIVVNAEVRTASGIGFPLHIVANGGGVTRSFGATDATVVPREQSEWRRRLALSRRGNVWSVEPRTYRMELWDTHGRLLRTLLRTGPWWDSVAAGSDPGLFADEKPAAEVIAMWEDSSGLLWTQLRIASRGWRPLSRTEALRRSSAPFQLREYDEFFDTVIEVIDPDVGAVVASTSFAGAVGLLLEGSVFARWVQTENDRYGLTLRRLVVQGYSRAGTM